jgi:hypothetical protein
LSDITRPTSESMPRAIGRVRFGCFCCLFLETIGNEFCLACTMIWMSFLVCYFLPGRGFFFLKSRLQVVIFQCKQNNSGIETFKHLLVECPLSQITWSLLPWTTRFNLSSLLPPNPLIFLLASLKKKSSQSFSTTLCRAAWWILWFCLRLMFAHDVCVDVVLFLMFDMIFWFLSSSCISAALSFALWVLLLYRSRNPFHLFLSNLHVLWWFWREGVPRFVWFVSFF